jgi:hypothetical protein
MASTYYDEFSKLTLDKMAQKMEDMTYLFHETRVPKKHYKAQLTKGVEEMIEGSVEINLIDTYYRTLEQLYKQKPKWLFQALLCLDCGVKPSTLKPAEYQALELTWLRFQETKNAKTVDKVWREEFSNIEKHGATYSLKRKADE